MPYASEHPNVDIRIEDETEGTPRRVVVDFNSISLSNYDRLVLNLPADSDEAAERMTPIDLVKESLYRYIGGRFISQINAREYQIYIVPKGKLDCELIKRHARDFLKNRASLTVPHEQLVRG